MGTRAVREGRTIFDCVTVTQVTADGSYFKAELIVAKGSHIKQLATVGECDVEFDLIAHRSSFRMSRHLALRFYRLFPRTESSSPDDRSPSRWLALARSRWLSRRSGSHASGGLC